MERAELEVEDLLKVTMEVAASGRGSETSLASLYTFYLQAFDQDDCLARPAFAAFLRTGRVAAEVSEQARRGLKNPAHRFFWEQSPA